MNNYLAPAIVGFISLVLLFGLCFFLVIGVKITLYQCRKYFSKPVKEVKVMPSKPKAPRTVKPSKSIEIDADQFDKIYFKKSS